MGNKLEICNKLQLQADNNRETLDSSLISGLNIIKANQKLKNALNNESSCSSELVSKFQLDDDFEVQEELNDSENNDIHINSVNFITGHICKYRSCANTKFKFSSVKLTKLMDKSLENPPNKYIWYGQDTKKNQQYIIEILKICHEQAFDPNFISQIDSEFASIIKSRQDNPYIIKIYDYDFGSILYDMGRYWYIIMLKQNASFTLTDLILFKSQGIIEWTDYEILYIFDQILKGILLLLPELEYGLTSNHILFCLEQKKILLNDGLYYKLKNLKNIQENINENNNNNNNNNEECNDTPNKQTSSIFDMNSPSYIVTPNRSAIPKKSKFIIHSSKLIFNNETPSYSKEGNFQSIRFDIIKIILCIINGLWINKYDLVTIEQDEIYKIITQLSESRPNVQKFLIILANKSIDLNEIGHKLSDLLSKSYNANHLNNIWDKWIHLMPNQLNAQIDSDNMSSSNQEINSGNLDLDKARCYQIFDIESSLGIYYQSFLKLPNNLSDYALMTDSLLIFCELLTQINDFQRLKVFGVNFLDKHLNHTFSKRYIIKDLNKYLELLTYLGRAYNELKLYDTSKTYYMKIMKLCIQNESDKSLIKHLLNARKNLAEIYAKHDDIYKALEQYQLYAKLLDKYAMYDTFNEVINTYRIISNLAQKMNDMELSQQYLYKLYEIYKIKYPQKVEERINILEDIVEIYITFKDHDNAIKVCFDILDIIKKTIKLRHSNMHINIILKIADFYYKAQDYKAAIHFYQEYHIILKWKGQKIYDISLSNLADCLIKIGEIQEGYKKYEEYRDNLLNKYGAENEDYLRIVDKLVEINYSLGNLKSALDMQLSVIHIKQKVFLKNLDYYALSMNNIGEIYLALKQYNEAIEWLEKAYKLRETTKISMEDIICSLINLGMAYDSLKNRTKAMEYLWIMVNHLEKLDNFKGSNSTLIVERCCDLFDQIRDDETKFVLKKLSFSLEIARKEKLELF